MANGQVIQEIKKMIVNEMAYLGLTSVDKFISFYPFSSASSAQKPLALAMGRKRRLLS